MADLEQSKYGGTIRKLQILRLVLVVVAVALAVALVVVRVYCFPKELTDGADSGLNGETGDNQEELLPESSFEPQIPFDQKPSDDLEENPSDEDESGSQGEDGEDPSGQDESGSQGEDGEDPSDEDESGSQGEDGEDPSGQGESDGQGEDGEDPPGQGESDGQGEDGEDPSGQDQSDIPETNKEDEKDPKDVSSESIIQENQNDDDTVVSLNAGFGLFQTISDGDTSQGGETGENQGELTDNSDIENHSFAMTAFIVLIVLFWLDVVAVIILSIVIYKKKRMKPELHVRTERIVSGTPGSTGMETATAQSRQRQFLTNKVAVGKLHNIGARPYQEDSSGLVELNDGVLAIVADGMGGLSGGDKVSQKIVFTMLSYGESLKSGQMDGILTQMVNGVNEEVNKMLGPNGLYKSGSTLLAVLVRRHRFHWIAVGDSHIYFYHRGCLTQLNQEHNREQELLKRAAQGEISFGQARNDPKKSGLTSFVGMGKLKYVEKSLVSIPVEQGDRIVLMTDGVFNAVSDQEIASVLKRYPDVSEAAAELERMVIRRANPKQDNFTAVILCI